MRILNKLLKISSNYFIVILLLIITLVFNGCEKDTDPIPYPKKDLSKKWETDLGDNLKNIKIDVGRDGKLYAVGTTPDSLLAFYIISESGVI